MKTLFNTAIVISVIAIFGFSQLQKSSQVKVLRSLEVLSDKEEGEFVKYVDNDEVSEEPKEGSGGTEKYHSQEAQDYFNEICLGREYGSASTKAYRWKKDVKVYVHGEVRDYLRQELNDVVSELNEIINTIEIEVVSDKNEANTFIYLGSQNNFTRLYPYVDKSLVNSNWGYFELYDGQAVMYVDLFRATEVDAQKHLLREELTQLLGLCNDSWKYKESIFYQGWTTTTEFAPIDRELIDMLYNN